MDDLIYASASELAQAILAKRVSSEEVVKAHLKRIHDVNPRLNAVVCLGEEQALKQAQAADQALARGAIKGPLHGVPMTVKDSFETAGVVSTSGTRGRVDYVPTEDATAVARLRAAGAILMGKTNLPEFTWWGETDNLVYGRSNNPYDVSRTPGGSSGGAAAILAAGGSPLELGSDTYGSIRQPSHFCGTAGIKPTSGRVPRTGLFPPATGPVDWIEQVGPMARTVDDLVLTLPILSGVDGRDPDIISMPLGDPRTVRLKGLRTAFFTDNGVVAAEAQVVETVEKTVRFLEDSGLTVEEGRPSCFTRVYDLLAGLWGADGDATPRAMLKLAGTSLEDVSPSLRIVMSFPPISTADFFALYAEAVRFRQESLAFMQKYDVIVSPPCACVAPTHGKIAEINNILSYTMIFNLLGWPAVVVRAGTSSEGLPIGVQVAARAWREDVALAVAKHIESGMCGFRRPPL